MSEPIVHAALWGQVMQAAGYRCQCTGQCGNPHAKSHGRCPREHDHHGSKHRGPIRLTAAPADPTADALAAARQAGDALRAWCPDCYDGARRAARRTARTTATPAQESLF